MRITATPDKLTTLALRCLEDALAQAEVGIVERLTGHRLALMVLVDRGISQRWQAESFWDAMARPINRTDIPNAEHYVRTRMMISSLTAWYSHLGIPEPSCIERGMWARYYAPEMVDPGTGARQHELMCNRYQPGERQNITRLFNATSHREVNEGPPIVHPRDPGWVIRQVDGARVLEQMTWGFPVVLTGKRGLPLKPKPVNNARFDKLGGFWRRWATSPAHRCLIPATRFAEATGQPGSMVTTWLSLKGQPIFAWAGLWRASDEWGEVYTGVMTDCDAGLAAIHDRAPVIIEPDDWDTWLTAPFEELAQFDRAIPASRIHVEWTNVPWRDGGRGELYT